MSRLQIIKTLGFAAAAGSSLLLTQVSPAIATARPALSTASVACVSVPATLSVASLATAVPSTCDIAGHQVIFPGNVTLVVPPAGQIVTWYIDVSDPSADFSDLSVANVSGKGVAAVKANGAKFLTYGNSTAINAIKNSPQFVTAQSSASQAVAQAASPKCTNQENNVSAKISGNTFSWSINPAGNYSVLLSGLKGGFNWTATGYNLCGLTQNAFSSKSNYLGTTTRGANIFGNSNCDSNDGYNTVNFGGLGSTTNAVTCRWTNLLGVAINADIAFNSSRLWTLDNATSSSLNCPSGYMRLYDIAAHEVGHVFGLNHVSAGSPLIMDPYEDTCDWNYPGGIGYGDYLGMRTNYAQ